DCGSLEMPAGQARPVESGLADVRGGQRHAGEVALYQSAVQISPSREFDLRWLDLLRESRGYPSVGFRHQGVTIDLGPARAARQCDSITRWPASSATERISSKAQPSTTTGSVCRTRPRCSTICERESHSTASPGYSISPVERAKSPSRWRPRSARSWPST